MKTTGAEWNKFYTDEKYWHVDVYHDDVLILVNGEEVEDYDKISDSALVDIQGGYVVLGGDTEKDPSLETYFRRWKNSKSLSSFP